jgi:hypothetical protein
MPAAITHERLAIIERSAGVITVKKPLPDPENRVAEPSDAIVVGERFKNSGPGQGMPFGPEGRAVFERRPKAGQLFPCLRALRGADRASEFKQRCEGLSPLISASRPSHAIY